jgi:hypothetical protein
VSGKLTCWRLDYSIIERLQSANSGHSAQTKTAAPKDRRDILKYKWF